MKTPEKGAGRPGGRVPGGGKGREEGGWRDVAGLGRPK